MGKVAKVGEDRVKLRQEQSAPVLAELHDKSFDWKEQFVAQAPYGRVDQLCAGPLGRIQGIRLGRRRCHRQQRLRNGNEARCSESKNSLFAGNARTGRTAAILASIISTCRCHAVDPQFYLTQLLVNLRLLRTSDLPEWLPDRWKAAKNVRLTDFA